MIENSTLNPYGTDDEMAKDEINFLGCDIYVLK